jgi:hypothetical protein
MRWQQTVSTFGGKSANGHTHIATADMRNAA